MSQAHEDPSHLIAMAKLLLSEVLEEGLDHVEVPKAAEADSSPDETAPLAAKPSPGPASSTPPSRRGTISPHPDPAPLSPSELPPNSELPPHASLESVRETLGDCQRCPLCEERKKIVFGHGNPEADLMFIGEGPGANEDEQGLPFVGRAGDLLTQMIEKGMGLPREEVYICNIVKCRPPGNRTPLPQEVAACRPFLDGQIDAVRPKVIVSLGKPATGLLLDREVAITRIRGTWHDYKGIALMPTLHPAFVLRQYTDENRRAVWQDLQAALARIREQ